MDVSHIKNIRRDKTSWMHCVYKPEHNAKIFPYYIIYRISSPGRQSCADRVLRARRQKGHKRQYCTLNFEGI